MKDYIYALTFVLDGKPQPFYVGRTSDIPRRMKEHRAAANRGDTETKYQTIRYLDEVNLPFSYDILGTADTADDRYEQFYMYQLLCDGYELDNMRMGDAVKATELQAIDRMKKRGERFKNPAAFLTAVQREIEEEKARKKTAAVNAKMSAAEREDRLAFPSKYLFAWDKVLPESEGLRQARAKRATQVAKRRWDTR